MMKRNTKGLYKGEDKALENLGVVRLGKDEETKVYRIRAPKWVHDLLSEAGKAHSAQESAATAIGWFLSQRLDFDTDIEFLKDIRKKIAKMEDD